MTEMLTNLIAAARDKDVMLTTAESCTGGMIAAALTEVPGSSAVFDRGFVTYSNEAKMEMLGVQNATLDRVGAVSEEVALEMAEGALKNAQAQIAISVTGLAGPGGSEFKPEGRVCFGLAQIGEKTVTKTIEYGAIGRQNVRKAAKNEALQMVFGALFD
ncbi:CinA family protein [Epibacterium ulvae]|uniref:CinA family protein n=1 Tax=Epibacterium ulvae TaxID=1156985 RepID=UPI001BFC7038|nr:CinA family protein [Epibacterium ulvae]MBT8154382.1 CinA family protein [Epibacterium ulvae]